MEIFWKGTSAFTVEATWPGWWPVEFSSPSPFMPSACHVPNTWALECCLGCSGVTAVWLSTEQWKGTGRSNWFVSRFDRDRSILCCRPREASPECVALMWDSSGGIAKTPGRLEFISTKGTDMKGWVDKEGMQLEYKARLGLNCFSRPPRFFFLFWHQKMKKAFPA